jgi:hypothetical protein
MVYRIGGSNRGIAEEGESEENEEELRRLSIDRYPLIVIGKT